MPIFLTDGATVNPNGGWFTLIAIAVMLLVLWFVMIRPQRKQEKEIDNMRKNLSVGDEIVTIGGIVGIIIAINTSASGEDTITIVSSRDRTRIMLLKSAVSRVQVPANAGDEESKDSKDAGKDKDKEKKD